MTETIKKIENMMEMLPETDQILVLELVKKLVLTWDPDYVKLTPSERLQLENAEKEDRIPMREIDWDS